MPPRSYLRKWIDANEIYFPGSGTRVTVNIGEIDYETEFWKLESLIETLEKEHDIVSSVDSWMSKFRNFIEDIDAFNSTGTSQYCFLAYL